MNPESETNRIKGLLASSVYFDEYLWQRSNTVSLKPRRKPSKSKKTLATRAKNKQAKQNRKKNRR